MPRGIYQHKKGRRWKVKDTSKYVIAHREGRAAGFKKGNQINLGKQNRTGKHSEESIQKMIEFQNRPEIKKKKSEWNIAHPNRKFSNTKIEQKIATELEKRKLAIDEDFYQNFGIKSIKNVDFYLPKWNTVIECDGCYYHACPEHGNHKNYQDAPTEDERKTKLLQDAGYNVYRFWEHDINKSPEECINKINLF